jgi:3-hydroxyisobutyrate dehydrogenase
VRPVLDAIGARTVVVGERIGEASALKLACNAWVLSITVAAAQSLALARALDLPPMLVLDAIRGGPADSQYAQLKGESMLTGDFVPAFGLDSGRKDLALIAAAAASAGVNEALLDGLRTLYDAASEHGHGGEDLAAVYTAFSRG